MQIVQAGEGHNNLIFFEKNDSFYSISETRALIPEVTISLYEHLFDFVPHIIIGSIYTVKHAGTYHGLCLFIFSIHV